ncbi:MAG: hypothetical protein M1828_005520 [Chrysothrix sp. TS-e1954]|nr:MAG: hypothetical protein M1828_005520 [Chrysothrix sp. TS-e1954]
MAEPTQQPEPTQNEAELDARRLGRNNSGLTDSDVSDVLCILHPSSQASHAIVQNTARLNPQHVLQQRYADSNLDSIAPTQSFQAFDVAQAQDIALRFSSHVCDPTIGFCFGRNVSKCDVNLDPSNDQRRVSNTHFRIFINRQGVLMIEDMSTNGTVVDMVTLGGKRNLRSAPRTQILENGSVVEILAPVPNEIIRFFVRIPPRDDHKEAYMAKYQAYMQHVAIAEDRTKAAHQGAPIPDGAARGMLAARLAGPPNTRNIPPPAPPLTSSHYGMRWDGGGQYKCVGLLGKGAFATVYHLATRRSGEYFAAKELERKRAMKDGVLDGRIHNEMKIMQGLTHESIVQYVDYVETAHHLYIIMEYVPGGDLSGYMNSHGTLPEEMGRTMSRQILRALAYLHEKNITHRDIKPDNILICSEDPFVVKLSDFGLSKVVKSNDTFLTTFCGTMLYCAPEVFPQYDAHAAGVRKKRRHSDGPRKNPYSQLVDVWSYAAVLWYVLCGKTPFEGVPDPTGRGMFAMIVKTQLDATPLRLKGISEEAISVLLQMLIVNPEIRFTEVDCLRHPWLDDGSYVPNGPEPSERLNAIDEEDEDLDASQLSLDDNSARDDAEGPPWSHNEAIDADLHSFKRVKMDFPSAPGIDESANRIDGRIVNGHFRASAADDDEPWLDSNDAMELLNQGAVITDEDTRQSSTGLQISPAPLFGEITNPLTRSSGVFGTVNKAQEGEGTRRAPSYDLYPHDLAHASRVPERTQGEAAAREPPQNLAHHVRNKLSAGDSMLPEIRDLHMSSPAKGNSASNSYKAPTTPETPTRIRYLSNGTHSSPKQDVNHNDVTPRQPKAHDRQSSNDRKSSSSEITPRQPPAFNRQINLPISASLFYDPYDASTHNLEYASRVSGINFSDLNAASNVDLNSLPATAFASATTNQNLSQHAESDRLPLAPTTQNTSEGAKSEPNGITAASTQSNGDNIDGKHMRPPSVDPPTAEGPQMSDFAHIDNTAPPPDIPLLGRLTSTPDSIHPITIPLTTRHTTFGRHPGCTIIYPSPKDTRIPKRALDIWFHAPAISQTADNASDLARLPQLRAIIRTEAKSAIRVNGVVLGSHDKEGRYLWGNVYTGDEVVVWPVATSSGSGGERLAFRCEFFSGLSARERRDGEGFEVFTG